MNVIKILINAVCYLYENEVLDKLIKEGKTKLARKFNLTVILMTLSLSIIEDLRSSFLIFTPKHSQFLKPQNLLQLFLISIYF